jgi:adenylate kinase
MSFEKNKINNLIILGPSGSGKGTQAEFLARKFNLKILDGGEYLRKLMTEKSKNAQRTAKTMNKGVLVPTDIVRDWMKKQIFSNPGKGIIFSGQPRMIGEAKLTLKWFEESGRGLPIVIFLNVSTREVLKRLEKRYICAKCKKVHTLEKYPTKPCNACGGEIVKRLDDAPKMIRNRLAYFKTQVAQTLEFFKKKGILIKVNGEQSIEETHEEIVRKLESYQIKKDR